MHIEEIRNICNAAAGLYGIIHVRHLCEVLSYLGENALTRKALLTLLQEQLPPNCCLKAGFLYCDHVFAGWEAWEHILARSAAKPLCLLPLEELLPYRDHDHVEWTPAAQQLLSLLANQGDPGMLKEVLLHTALDMRRGQAPQEAMKRLLDANVIVHEKDLRQFGDCFLRFYHSTRLYIDRGFTPEELKNVHFSKQKRR